MIQYPQRMPADEAAALDGDAAFLAVNMRDDPGILRPGVLSYAENCALVNGTLSIIPGCDTLPCAHEVAGTFDATGKLVSIYPDWVAQSYTAGAASRVRHLNKLWVPTENVIASEIPGTSPKWVLDPAFWGPYYLVDAAGFIGGELFDDPESQQKFLLLSGNIMYAARQWSFVQAITFSGTPFRASDRILQVYEKVIILRGADEEPLIWDGESTTLDKYSDVVDNVPEGPVRLPSGRNHFYHAGRWHVIHGKSELAISGINELVYDPNLFNEVLNFGQADRLEAGLSYDRGIVLVFGQRSIYALSGAVGDYQDLQVERISSTQGTIAPESLVSFGGFCAFLNTQGIWTVDQVQDNRIRPSEFPLSGPIEPLIRQINWSVARGASAAIVGARYYIAVPWNNPRIDEPATGNNCVLVYNIEREVWEPHWYAPNLDIVRLIRGQWSGEDRLFGVDRKGFLLLFEQGEIWKVGNSEEPIEQRFISRGYNGMEPQRVKGLRMQVNIGTSAPSYSLSVRTQGVSSERKVVTGKTRDLTRSRLLSQRRWVPSNINNDHAAKGREDYSVTLGEEDFYLHEGVRFDLEQEFEESLPLIDEGRYVQLIGKNTTGRLSLRAVRMERRDGSRNSIPKI